MLSVTKTQKVHGPLVHVHAINLESCVSVFLLTGLASTAFPSKGSPSEKIKPDQVINAKCREIKFNKEKAERPQEKH